MAVMEFTAWLMQNGERAFSPIVYGHEMAKKHQLPSDAAWWARWNMDIFKNCEAMYLLRLPGWEQSTGVALERKWAKMFGTREVHFEFVEGNYREVYDSLEAQV